MEPGCFVFMVTTQCPECGQPLMLDGPALQVKCRTCLSDVEVPASEWETILAFPLEMQPKLRLKEGQLHTSATLGPEFSMRVRWGPQRPQCACGALLDLSGCPAGTDGELHCTCGKTVTTFPAPGWLKDVSLGADQDLGSPSGRSAHSRGRPRHREPDLVFLPRVRRQPEDHERERARARVRLLQARSLLARRAVVHDPPGSNAAAVVRLVSRLRREPAQAATVARSTARGVGLSIGG